MDNQLFSQNSVVPKVGRAVLTPPWPEVSGATSLGAVRTPRPTISFGSRTRCAILHSRRLFRSVTTFFGYALAVLLCMSTTAFAQEADAQLNAFFKDYLEQRFQQRPTE